MQPKDGYPILDTYTYWKPGNFLNASCNNPGWASKGISVWENWLVDGSNILIGTPPKFIGKLPDIYWECYWIVLTVNAKPEIL